MTLSLYEYYGVCLKAENECKRALKIYEKVSKVRERVKGFGHRDTMICNTVRAGVLAQIGRLREAEELLRKVAEYGEICLNKDDWMIGAIKCEEATLKDQR